MRSFKVISLVLLLIVLASCKKYPNRCEAEIRDPVFLVGVWEEYLNPDYTYYAAREWNIHFKTNGKFTLVMDNFTDAADPTDSCSNFSWYEYAAGTYYLDEEKLHLDGVYTDSLFQPKTSGCYRIGPFEHSSYATTCDGELFLYDSNPRKDPGDPKTFVKVK